MRDQIHQRASVVLVVLLAVFGFISHQLNNLWPFSASTIGVISSVLLIAGISFAIASGYMGMRAWHGYEYKIMPSASELERVRDSMKSQFEAEECTGDFDSYAESEFRQGICKYYIEASAANFELNLTKSEWLHKSFSALRYAVAFSLVSYGVWKIAN